ncbi:hypothetical protein SS50377_23476 [Spironucleus salmonicida]|uniref:Uncharacterized protein n=1 Tax=Spironucleus salmonicida TaxID=348837 RepID=V6LZG4_9EUKA|nr:hypothetical protein SS50377_23476 [Spironucleus salmonicida]|eukprot:EST46214.1 Hypothetical protein SS50377_13809 [Spironucleus salmonicida]
MSKILQRKIPIQKEELSQIVSKQDLLKQNKVQKPKLVNNLQDRPDFDCVPTKVIKPPQTRTGLKPVVSFDAPKPRTLGTQELKTYYQKKPIIEKVPDQAPCQRTKQIDYTKKLINHNIQIPNVSPPSKIFSFDHNESDQSQNISQQQYPSQFQQPSSTYDEPSPLRPSPQFLDVSINKVQLRTQIFCSTCSNDLTDLPQENIIKLAGKIMCLLCVQKEQQSLKDLQIQLLQAKKIRNEQVQLEQIETAQTKIQDKQDSILDKNEVQKIDQNQVQQQLQNHNIESQQLSLQQKIIQDQQQQLLQQQKQQIYYQQQQINEQQRQEIISQQTSIQKQYPFVVERVKCPCCDDIIETRIVGNNIFKININTETGKETELDKFKDWNEVMEKNQQFQQQKQTYTNNFTQKNSFQQFSSDTKDSSLQQIQQNNQPQPIQIEQVLQHPLKVEKCQAQNLSKKQKLQKLRDLDDKLAIVQYKQNVLNSEVIPNKLIEINPDLHYDKFIPTLKKENLFQDENDEQLNLTFRY